MSYKETSAGGSGTVTTVSVATANGFSGTVANATTTPAITIVAGAITPTSVAATGNVTGANLSGTNTGDQTLAGLGIQTCFLSGTVSNNANPQAWADVTGLSFSLASGHTYLFEFEALTVGSATSNWARYGVNGPTASLLTVNIQRPNAANGTGHQDSSATAYDTGTDISATNASGSLPVRISGVITTTAAGTLILRQRNTTAGAAVTTNAGSWGRLTLIA